MESFYSSSIAFIADYNWSQYHESGDWYIELIVNMMGHDIVNKSYRTFYSNILNWMCTVLYTNNTKPAKEIAANLDPKYVIVKQMNSSYHSESLKMVLIKWRRVGLLRTLRINARASVTDRRSHGMQTIISVRMTNTTSDVTVVEGE